MPRKQVLIAGASGLVGYAAMRHFSADPNCDVIALSRRAPDNTQDARFLPLDLNDAAACEQLAKSLPDITHLVYAALYERPGLVAGWQEREQIETNDRMLRNVLDPLERHAEESTACDVAAGHQGLRRTRPPAFGAGARKSLGNARATELLLESGKPLARPATGQGLDLVDPASGADRRLFHRQRHERDPRPWRLRRPTARGRVGPALPRRRAVDVRQMLRRVPGKPTTATSLIVTPPSRRLIFGLLRCCVAFQCLL